MAEVVEERPEAAAELAPRQEARRPAYTGRFLVAYLVLGLLAGVAVAGGLVLFTGDGESQSTDWSNWRPTGAEATYPNQISEHVGRRYRLPSGAQIVGVIAGPPKVQDIDVRAVAIQPENATSEEDIEVLPTEDSLMYVLCGLGQNCSIREGDASQERHRLLRRESLELALYTFKYVDGIDSVIALLPPPPNAETNGTALFFQRRDFERELDQPLTRTLFMPNPPARDIVELVPPTESIRVDRLTRPYLFSYEFQQLQEGSAVIVLAPVAATE